MQARVRAVELESPNDNFLGLVYASDVSEVQSNSNKWTESIEVNEWVIAFKIDTGADVTVIPQEMHRETQDGPLQSTKCQLTGAGCQPLDVQGHLKGYLNHKNTRIEQDNFVVYRLGIPLLRHPAMKALAIVILVELVTL